MSPASLPEPTRDDVEMWLSSGSDAYNHTDMDDRLAAAALKMLRAQPIDQSREIRIVFDGAPGGPLSARFVEVEDSEGYSIRVGSWKVNPRHPGWFDLVLNEPLAEVKCPSCNITIRARMADAPGVPPETEQERQLAGFLTKLAEVLGTDGSELTGYELILAAVVRYGDERVAMDRRNEPTLREAELRRTEGGPITGRRIPNETWTNVDGEHGPLAPPKQTP